MQDDDDPRSTADYVLWVHGLTCVLSAMLRYQ